MIPAFSLSVPVQDVILAFDEICNHCSIDEQPVLDYFKTNYNRFLNKIPRENNNLEEWHTPFSTMFRQTHPPIWKFISTLKLDKPYNRMLIAQMLAGSAPPSQKRVYRDVNARITTLVKRYNNGSIILLLRDISYDLAAQ